MSQKTYPNFAIYSNTRDNNPLFSVQVILTRKFFANRDTNSFKVRSLFSYDQTNVVAELLNDEGFLFDGKNQVSLKLK